MKSSKAIQEQVDRSNIQLIRQTNGNVEQILKTIDHTLNYVVNSNLMLDATYRKITYLDFQTYNNIRKELSHLQSYDTKVTDVIILNAYNNWIINNNGLYPLNSYPTMDKLLDMFKLPYTSNWVLLETGELGKSDAESYGCKYTINLVKKMPYHTFEKRGLAIATIPACLLASEMENHQEAREVMIVNKENQIIIHADESKVGLTLAEAGYFNEQDAAKMSEKTGQFEINTASGAKSVTYTHSSFNDWVYVSFTELNVIKKDSRAIGWFTLFVCILMIGVSLTAVWFGSRKMYTPVKTILTAISERIPDPQLTKRDEFQIINEHLNELFTSNSSLKQEITKHSQQVRTFFLTKLFQGNVTKTEIEQKAELFGFSAHTQDWESQVVLTLQIDLLGQTRYDSKDLDLLLFAINNIIEEIVPQEERLPPVILDQTQVTMVRSRSLSTKNDQVGDDIYKLTETIQQKIKQFLDLDVSIGISLPFKSLHKTARAYQEGIEALKQRLKLGKGVIIPFSSINSGKHTLIYPFPSLLENELIDSIKLADEEKALELLRQWLDEVFHMERSPHEYQISLMRLLNDLMIVMQEAGIRLQQLDLQEGPIYEELLQLYVNTEIEAWFKTKIIMPMIQVFRDRRDSQYQNLSEQIIDMIQKHFDTDLTLEECASKLHYNSFYLSSVFKKETSMSFSEYLSMYRFNMAKKWLVETDMPIKDIAQKLTYNNPQNFIRSFRKQEGMTPGQYRTKYGVSE
ncbi:AraC family transcriptional regulator [Paenibacillus turpanensis]|uniref:AraC family transcriptional regulator n=1 Tax=Paenibacillus turpanensis TaxID=2689078 RepID=UPI003132AC60